uniref:SH2 domain containing 1B n=1 Tax=Rattus norvegicus TaxID=10116 RepID=A0ABK0KZZ3_RAT|nr:SH2 domain-containing protein 1B isoform X1 [Rattus norvegicus]
MDLPYYHGCLTKRACEALLLKGGADGNFLIRDSESVPGALCLCVSYKKLVYSYRIFREKHGYYRIQDPTRKEDFPSILLLAANRKTSLRFHPVTPVTLFARNINWNLFLLTAPDGESTYILSYRLRLMFQERSFQT